MLLAQPSVAWINTYGGPGLDYGYAISETGDAGKEYAYSVCQTTQGGYALTGFTDSFGSTGRDVWLVVTDHSGNTLWSQLAGLQDC